MQFYQCYIDGKVSLLKTQQQWRKIMPSKEFLKFKSKPAWMPMHDARTREGLRILRDAMDWRHGRRHR
jgi:hypothetical protein